MQALSHLDCTASPMFLNQKANSKLESKCIAALVSFAMDRDITISNIVVTERNYKWKFFRPTLDSILISYDCFDTTGKACVLADSLSVKFFWATPSSQGTMLPPWEAFPGSPRFTQGLQEAYWIEWQDWFDTLTTQQKSDYEVRYPVPDHVLVDPSAVYH